MNNKKRVLAGSFTTLVTAGVIVASVTNAGFDNNEARRVAVQRALDAHDLDAFHDAIGDGPLANQIDTQKDLDAIALSYQLRRENKFKEAREVLERAGIERPGKIGIRGPVIDIRDALDNADWDEFVQVAQNKKIFNTINTPEKFAQLVEIHELHKEGRHTEAQKIASDLGLRGKYLR
jgi:hypothetical protein